MKRHERLVDRDQLLSKLGISSNAFGLRFSILGDRVRLDYVEEGELPDCANDPIDEMRLILGMCIDHAASLDSLTEWDEKILGDQDSVLKEATAMRITAQECLEQLETNPTDLLPLVFYVGRLFEGIASARALEKYVAAIMNGQKSGRKKLGDEIYLQRYKEWLPRLSEGRRKCSSEDAARRWAVAKIYEDGDKTVSKSKLIKAIEVAKK